jgi:hypothetical protein
MPAYFSRFSRPVPAPNAAKAVPLHILVDSEGVVDLFKHPDHPNDDWMEKAELACEVVETPEPDPPHKAEYCFDITVFGEKRRVHIQYVPKRERYVLYSAFLDNIQNPDRPKDTLLAALNARQAFRIVPTAVDTIYVGRAFYRVDLDVRAGGQGRLLLDLLQPVPELAALTSEKGDYQKAPAGGFDEESVFDLIDRGLQGKLKTAPFARPPFDLIACTDLGREIADFVAIDSKNDRIVFIHAKAGKAQFSVSALQEVVGQAVKNLMNVTVRSNRLALELEVLKKKWKPEAGHTRERVRLGNRADFVKEAARLSSAPNAQREVWLVLGHLLSKSKAEKKIQTGNADPAVLQMFMLLSSLYTQCVSIGATLRIYCDP